MPKEDVPSGRQANPSPSDMGQQALASGLRPYDLPRLPDCTDGIHSYAFLVLEFLLSNIGHEGHEVEQTMQSFGPLLRCSLVQSTGGDRIRFSATA